MERKIDIGKMSKYIDNIYEKYGVECDVKYIDSIDSLSKMGLIVDLEEVFDINIPTDLLNDQLIFNREMMIELIENIIQNNLKKGKGWKEI